MYDSEFERQEDLSEIEKLMRLQVEILHTRPDLTAQLQEAYSQEMTHAVCRFCRRKRMFIAYVQTLALVYDLRYQRNNSLGALSCAFRTPATRLMALDVMRAANDLVYWYYHEARPGEERTEIVEQPAWYSKDAMEDDGHE